MLLNPRILYGFAESIDKLEKLLQEKFSTHKRAVENLKTLFI
jgi:hypothetical protein